MCNLQFFGAMQATKKGDREYLCVYAELDVLYASVTNFISLAIDSSLVTFFTFFVIKMHRINFSCHDNDLLSSLAKKEALLLSHSTHTSSLIKTKSGPDMITFTTTTIMKNFFCSFHNILDYEGLYKCCEKEEELEWRGDWNGTT